MQKRDLRLLSPWMVHHACHKFLPRIRFSLGKVEAMSRKFLTAERSALVVLWLVSINCTQMFLQTRSVGDVGTSACFRSSQQESCSRLLSHRVVRILTL